MEALGLKARIHQDLFDENSESVQQLWTIRIKLSQSGRTTLPTSQRRQSSRNFGLEYSQNFERCRTSGRTWPKKCKAVLTRTTQNL